MLSWIKVLSKRKGKAGNICKKKSESEKNKETHQETKKKKKSKETKKQSHNKNLERQQKSTICDYMNIHDQYKKELILE